MRGDALRTDAAAGTIGGTLNTVAAFEKGAAFGRVES